MDSLKSSGTEAAGEQFSKVAALTFSFWIIKILCTTLGETGGDAVLQSACKMHLEGIVSKRLAAPYTSGRSGDWAKAKCRAGHEVVLGGWTTEGQIR